MSLNLRKPLADALRSALPATWRIVGGPATVTRVDRPTVHVWTTELVPFDSAPNGHFEATYTLQLLTAHQQPQKADDALDDYLDELLPALWAQPGYTLTRAVREVNEDGTLHAWSLTVTAAVAIQED